MLAVRVAAVEKLTDDKKGRGIPKFLKDLRRKELAPVSIIKRDGHLGGRLTICISIQYAGQGNHLAALGPQPFHLGAKRLGGHLQGELVCRVSLPHGMIEEDAESTPGWRWKKSGDGPLDDPAHHVTVIGFS